MTLKEIAREANVSVSTVSRVLNSVDTTAASEETKEKIRAIAARTNYAPNTAAKILQKKKAVKVDLNKNIYLLIPTPRAEVAGNVYFSQLLNSIEQATIDAGYVPSFAYTIDDLYSTFPPEHLRNTPAAGLIIVGRFENVMLEYLSQFFKQIVYVGCNSLKVNCDQIVCNCFQATCDAVAYLHELGHQNIGFIGTSSEDRIRGYFEGMHQQKLAVNEDHIISDVDISMEGGYQGALRLLKKATALTAIICANDRTAIGALRACQELGRQVPDDISIIGIDDIEAAKYVTPPLTSIHVPLTEMGQIAVQQLISRINHQHKLPLIVTFPYRIEKRLSCKKIK